MKPQRAAPLTAPLIYADRLFPADFATRAVARAALRRGARPADRQPARPHRSALVSPTNAPFPDPARAVRHARPLCVPHALQPGRAARGPRHPAHGRRRGRDRCAQDLAHVRRALSPVPRHADAALARPGVRRACSASTMRLSAETADRYFDRISECLAQPGVPAARAVRALQHRGDRHDREPARSARRITTRSASPAGRAAWSPPTGPTRWSIPSSTAFAANVEQLRRAHRLTTRSTWRGYLDAHRQAPRLSSSSMGATSTDHGHPTAQTADLAAGRGRGAVRASVSRASSAPGDAELFRAPDADRDGAHEPRRRAGDADPSRARCATTIRRCSPRFGRDKGADIPTRTDYVRALKPLLDRFGNEPRPHAHPLHARRDALLARAGAARRPLSGAQARARLVVPRQPRGHAALPRADHRDRRLLQHRRLQRRHARLPVDPGAARRGAARRLRLPRRLVVEHRLDEDEAREVARDLAYNLAKKAYKL